MRDDDDYHRQPCDLCGDPTIFGPHLYEGEVLPHLGKLFVCKTCMSGNWDGVGPAHEPAFVNALQRRGVPLPERNAKGWYPLDPLQRR